MYDPKYNHPAESMIEFILKTIAYLIIIVAGFGFCWMYGMANYS